jgi:hypothetical protein
MNYAIMRPIGSDICSTETFVIEQRLIETNHNEINTILIKRASSQNKNNFTQGEMFQNFENGSKSREISGFRPKFRKSHRPIGV